METALQGSVTKLKQDLLAYKRDLLNKKKDFPVLAPPQTPGGNRSGSGIDPLTKHFKQEARAKMAALHNQLKICCEGIQGDAQLDDLGTDWQDAEDDDIRKAMKDKKRWISRMIQLQTDFSVYETQVTMVASSELHDDTSNFGIVKALVDKTET